MSGRGIGAGAFTLVEVVMALGIFSFCLVVILGMFSVGLQNGRASTENTALASMAWQVAGSLQVQTNGAGFQTNYYFDAQGVGVGATNGAAAYFACKASLERLPAPSPTGDTNLTTISLLFTWPCDVARPPHTNTVYGSLPR